MLASNTPRSLAFQADVSCYPQELDEQRIQAWLDTMTDDTRWEGFSHLTLRIEIEYEYHYAILILIFTCFLRE